MATCTALGHMNKKRGVVCTDCECGLRGIIGQPATTHIVAVSGNTCAYMCDKHVDYYTRGRTDWNVEAIYPPGRQTLRDTILPNNTTEPTCACDMSLGRWGMHAAKCEWVAWNAARKVVPKKVPRTDMNPMGIDYSKAEQLTWDKCTAHHGESYYDMLGDYPFYLQCRTCKLQWCAGSGHPPNHPGPRHTLCMKSHCGTYGT